MDSLVIGWLAALMATANHVIATRKLPIAEGAHVRQTERPAA
ncbi:MAG: hypothetical protein WA948_01715 [Pontixanthobacter sp.]